jgi:hypothetical protein
VKPQSIASSADDADVDGALLEDAVLGQQALDVVDELREGLAQRMSSASPAGRSWCTPPGRK